MSAIVKVPGERLNPCVIRNMARKHLGLTKEQMKGMHVHHFPHRSNGGRDIPEHLYVCSEEFHRKVWHSDEYFMGNLYKAIQSNIGRKHSPETCKKKSDALKGRNVGHAYGSGDNNPNSKPVIVNGVCYTSQYEAADAVGLTLQGLRYRVKHWGEERGYCYG